MTKKRADVYLVERGVVESREKARRLIDEGKVTADGRPVAKPSTLLEVGSNLQIEQPLEYVSRGGYKIEKAVRVFDVRVEGKRALDVGVGTGGFTDYLLKNGAAQVVAVDVGYGQVAWSIRNDPRVKLIERSNIRELSIAELPEPVDIATVDLSFISVRKVIDKLAELVRPRGELVILIKPQFEAGRAYVGRKGIVRDPSVHKMVLAELVEFLTGKGLSVEGITYSPIKGGKGNIEFLVYALLQEAETEVDWSDKIEAVVNDAHMELRDER